MNMNKNVLEHMDKAAYIIFAVHRRRCRARLHGHRAARL